MTGFWDNFHGSEEAYTKLVKKRILRNERFIYMIYNGATDIGVIELSNLSHDSHVNYSYLHLLYLRNKYRGTECSSLIHSFIVDSVINENRIGILLSVSKKNHRAIGFYKKNGWSFHSQKNDKSSYFTYKLQSS